MRYGVPLAERRSNGRAPVLDPPKVSQRRWRRSVSTCTCTAKFGDSSRTRRATRSNGATKRPALPGKVNRRLPSLSSAMPPVSSSATGPGDGLAGRAPGRDGHRHRTFGRIGAGALLAQHQCVQRDGSAHAHVLDVEKLRAEHPGHVVAEVAPDLAPAGVCADRHVRALALHPRRSVRDLVVQASPTAARDSYDGRELGVRRSPGRRTSPRAAATRGCPSPDSGSRWGGRR